MEWYEKLDQLEKKGYRVTDRIRYPDGHYGRQMPEHWTAEQIVNHAFAYVETLERECPNLKYTALQGA